MKIILISLGLLASAQLAARELPDVDEYYTKLLLPQIMASRLLSEPDNGKMVGTPQERAQQLSKSFKAEGIKGAELTSVDCKETSCALAVTLDSPAAQLQPTDLYQVMSWIDKQSLCAYSVAFDEKDKFGVNVNIECES